MTGNRLYSIPGLPVNQQRLTVYKNSNITCTYLPSLKSCFIIVNIIVVVLLVSVSSLPKSNLPALLPLGQPDQTSQSACTTPSHPQQREDEEEAAEEADEGEARLCKLAKIRKRSKDTGSSITSSINTSINTSNER
ncbi:hypothetical protein H107_08291 [Trichophyton rubrum CBS 202.88]|nr:hypothetical protein H107_08291 [Trichophyton rubrum CBS 202.88]